MGCGCKGAQLTSEQRRADRDARRQARLEAQVARKGKKGPESPGYYWKGQQG